MKMIILTIFITILILPPYISCYKILGVFPTIGRSHFIVGEAIMKGLLNAGHEITFLTPFPQKKPIPNWTDIEITGLKEEFEGKMKNYSAMHDLRLSGAQMLPFLFNSFGDTLNKTFQHKNVKKMMATGKFDLVIVEIFCTEATIGFGEYFNAPVIGVSTFSATKWTNDLVGSPAPLSYVPHAFLNLSDKLTFLERCLNILMNIYELIIIHLINYPNQIKFYNEAFPNAKLTLFDAMKNVSLVLLNTHFTLGLPRPYVPNMIEVGGLHINRNVNALPYDIQDFLDSAKNGVIYFSMGSHVHSADFSIESRQAFFKAFSKLKQKILWKFEDESIKMPENVFVKNWMPQNDILAHPNIKCFISHGGLLSTTESIYHGVPIIGIPLFGDQLANVDRAEKNGYGLKLEFLNITETSVSWVLQEILNNPKYSQAAKQTSKLYRDQPMTPMETALFWIEYVLRHNGAPHMHSASLELSFMQYHNLDVYVFFIILIFFLIYVNFKFVINCYRKCCSGKSKDKSDGFINLTKKKRI